LNCASPLTGESREQRVLLEENDPATAESRYRRAAEAGNIDAMQPRAPAREE
jgi:hypothetical protein